MPYHAVLENLQKFLDLDLDVDDLQNSVSSSLSKDRPTTSMVKFSWWSDQ